MRNKYHTAYWLAPVAACLLSACASYKQNVMFTVPDGYALTREAAKTEKNYVVQKNDQLQVDVYTNNGERIIDPDLRLTETTQGQNEGARPTVTYLVDLNGVVKLPMVGEIKVEGLTLREMEAIIQKEYSRYYNSPLAVVKYLNKRVIVLGSPGGQVIPLANENVELAEVLALAGGIDITGKANNIRVLRNDQVFLADFSTIDGYLKGNMIMEPGDIVYVEQVRKPLSEATRDYGPLLSVLVSVLTLIIVINNN